MRGQPWLRLLFVVFIFAALSVPVWRLTHPAPIAAAATPVVAESTPAPTTVFLEVEVTFAGPPPTDFQLKEPGQTILQSGGDGSSETTARATWHAHLPKEGVDLTFEAHWPDDAA
ncbi:MAG: hypothetical protein JO117_07155, partial [Verrucomicrobia bacterium]|nr:hypothetical protein [Verrucomicrobiota bacterium]